MTPLSRPLTTQLVADAVVTVHPKMLFTRTTYPLTGALAVDMSAIQDTVTWLSPASDVTAVGALAARYGTICADDDELVLEPRLLKTIAVHT